MNSDNRELPNAIKDRCAAEQEAYLSSRDRANRIWSWLQKSNGIDHGSALPRYSVFK